MAVGTKSEKIDNNQLWASRFKKTTDPIAKQYSESITVDRPMFYHNIWGNQAHVLMLAHQGIIEDSHCREILKALEQIKEDFAEGKWDLQLQEEDVQMNVERYVIDHCGIENGGRMHTCRSRNDQVPVDTRLYVRDELFKVLDNLVTFIDEILDLSAKHTNTLMPGYTHTQHAQPITVAYWLTHYAAGFLRDVRRLSAAFDNNNTNPLGAGALSGTSFPIDRQMTSKLLGFPGLQEHAMDAVGSKDANLEILAAQSILFMTISRIAEEIIYGITCEFNTMILDDGFSMGSSMMPQKKNPGVLELARGRTGKMYGHLMHMLTTVKGLPSGYNRDYHEDKTTLVDSIALMNDTLLLMRGVVGTLTLKTERLESLVRQNFATATELANYLVRDHGIPFRLCHRIVGFVVRALVEEEKTFEDKQRVQELLAEKNIIMDDIAYEKTLNPARVIEEYNCSGGVAPAEVERMIKEFQVVNKANRDCLNAIQEQIATGRSQTTQIAQSVINGRSVKEAIAEHLQ